MNDMKPKKSTTIRSSEDLGHALRRSRLDGSMTQSEIANKSGTKQNAVSRIEGGNMGRTVQLIFKVLALLDLEIIIRPRSKSSAEDIENLFP
jgi:HTH-type transcriptional regulator/antitoxin HipB